MIQEWFSRTAILGWFVSLTAFAAPWTSVTAASLPRSSMLRTGHATPTESLIHCRLLQVGVSMLGDSADDVDISHTMYVCQSLDDILYTIEFRHGSDAARFSRPVWVTIPSEWVQKDSLEPTIVVPAGMQPQRRDLGAERTDLPDELEASQEDVAPEDFTRIGRKTLLAVRIVTNTEKPDVDLEEIEAAIFGTAPHPHSSSVTLEHSQEYNVSKSLDGPLVYQSVAEQYQAVTLGNLIYEPLRGPGYEKGVLEINLSDSMKPDFVMAGQGIQSLAPTILEVTAKRLGVTELTNAVDHVIYCLPNDSLLAGTTAWTAFTYLYEPYSYYQRSRCTKLSVVVHELGHSLGFRHSGVPTNAYADETGPMGYSVNQYGAPVKAFNSHKNWIAGWMQHFAVHLRRLSDNPQSSKTTYVGRVAAVADAPHVPIGREVVLLRLGRTLFLQYNRAKGFHRGTGTPNTVTIVYAEHDEDSSTRVASLEVGEIYEHDGYPRLGEQDEDAEPDDNLGLVVALCRVGMDDSTGTVIDYAELVVQWREPNAPKAADLNLALCNIRNDRSAPVLNFGVAIDKDPSRDDKTRTTPEEDIIVQSVSNDKQTVLLILGIIMAGVGMACLAASAYLVMRQCQMWERQEERRRRPPAVGLQKTETPADSFQTGQTSSFDTWTEFPSPTERDMTTSHSGHDEEDAIVEVQPPDASSLSSSPPPPQREWWEEIVENLKKLASKDEQR